MNDADNPSAAERGLERYLESLRDDPPRPGAELVPRVLRSARWQRTVRAPLRAVGNLVATLADGLEALFGSGRARRR